MTIADKLHCSATHKKGYDPACPVCCKKGQAHLKEARKYLDALGLPIMVIPKRGVK
jgi:hypothetical protein